MTRDSGKTGNLKADVQDFIFLTSTKITYDSNTKFFKVALPNGLEFDVTVDRLLDIF